MTLRLMGSRKSHPKPPLDPITKRIMPIERRIALQSRLCNDIPHYAGASLVHTHHALELVERVVSNGTIDDILDSDEKIVGYLYARAKHKYGDGREGWIERNTAFKDGYDLYFISERLDE